MVFSVIRSFALLPGPLLLVIRTKRELGSQSALGLHSPLSTGTSLGEWDCGCTSRFAAQVGVFWQWLPSLTWWPLDPLIPGQLILLPAIFPALFLSSLPCSLRLQLCTGGTRCDYLPPCAEHRSQPWPGLRLARLPLYYSGFRSEDHCNCSRTKHFGLQGNVHPCGKGDIN